MCFIGVVLFFATLSMTTFTQTFDFVRLISVARSCALNVKKGQFPGGT